MQDTLEMLEKQYKKLRKLQQAMFLAQRHPDIFPVIDESIFKDIAYSHNKEIKDILMGELKNNNFEMAKVLINWIVS